MSLPISPAEKKAVLEELLAGGEGETPEEAAADLASRAIHALLDARGTRKHFYLLSNPGHMWGVWGPYATTSGAHKAIAKVPVSHQDQKFLIFPHHQELTDD